MEVFRKASQRKSIRILATLLFGLHFNPLTAALNPDASFFDVRIVGLINERPVTNVDLILLDQFCEQINCRMFSRSKPNMSDYWSLFVAQESQLLFDLDTKWQKFPDQQWQEIKSKLPGEVQKYSQSSRYFQIFWQGYQIFLSYRSRLEQPIDLQEVQEVYLSDARWKSRGSLPQVQEQIFQSLSEMQMRKNWEKLLQLHTTHLKIRRFNDLEGLVDP